MRLIVTRPEPGATRTGRALEAIGHQPILSPMLDIAMLDTPLPAGPFQAVLATSGNAVRALAAHPARDKLAALPLLAVGDRTADAARRAGFAAARSAGGAVEDLVALARAELRPEGGPLLYAAGDVQAGDLAGLLEAAGYRTMTWVGYRSTRRTELAAPAAAAIRAGAADGALVYSRRGAEAFVRAVEAARLAPLGENFTCFAISAATAEPLRPATRGPIRVADRPDEASLLALLDESARGGCLPPRPVRAHDGTDRRGPASPGRPPDATETSLATDTTGPGGKNRTRRPVIIDLPADEVGRDPPEASGEKLAPDETIADSARPHDEPAPARDTSEPWTAAAVEPAPRPATDSASETVAPVAATMAPRKEGSGFGALLAAALLGGLIAGGGLVYAIWAGYLDLAKEPPAVQAASDPRLEADLAALRAEVAEMIRQTPQPTPAPDLAPLRTQVAGLEQALAEIRAEPPSAPAGPAVDPAAFDAVQSRLAELEKAAATPPPAPAPDPALEARLSELAAQVATLGGAVEARPDPSPEIARLSGETGDAARRIEALEGRAPVDLAPLQTSVDAISEKQTQLAAEQSGLAEKIGAAPTEERVVALEAAVAEARDRAELAVRLGPAVAADALAAAVQSGAPYPGELAALRALGLDEAALAPLEPHAANGVPTLAALGAAFDEQAAGVALVAPVADGAGAFDRLVQSARGLVEVRRGAPAAGADPGAVIARIRGALAAGDLKTAVGEWDAAPEAVKQPTAAWAQAAAARLAAEDLAARLRSDALARLGTEG